MMPGNIAIGSIILCPKELLYPKGCLTVDFFMLMSVWMTLEIKMFSTPKASNRSIYPSPVMARIRKRIKLVSWPLGGGVQLEVIQTHKIKINKRFVT